MAAVSATSRDIRAEETIFDGNADLTPPCLHGRNYDAKEH
ncbi:hypothetical protein GA0061083_0536 [Pseudarthrobacter enclensis]|nr:hypothetical protein GA0061083_0536 [Pseudarthrobacter enclensis]